MISAAGSLLKAVALAAFACHVSAAAAQTRLLVSTFFPPPHPIHSQVMRPWAAGG
jgi:hypothetical protein